MFPTVWGEDEPEERVVADAVGDAHEVLDCGCGSGRIARCIRGATVDGIELSEASARAAESVCRTVIRGSLTDSSSWKPIDGRRYDAIVFCHVLEHLTDPLEAIRLASRHLKEGGRFVVVLPNVATWRMRYELLMGHWDYADEGILDRTHVYFYTRKTARELLVRAGLRIRRERSLLGLPPSGNILRRATVAAVRSLSVDATAQAFLFVADVGA